MKGSDVLCGLNYFEDALNGESVLGKGLKKEIIRILYVVSASAIIVIACVVILMAVLKGGFYNNNQPLDDVIAVGEAETQSEEQSEPAAAGFRLSREFTTVIYGYAGETAEITDPEVRELICSVIESVPLREASEEDWEEYRQLMGQYPLVLGDTFLAMTSQYLRVGEIGLFRFADENGMKTIRSVIEENIPK